MIVQIIVPVGTTVDVQKTPVVVDPPPTGSALADLAASLAPGSWGELVSANINTSLCDPGSPNTTLRMHYCNSAPWTGDGIAFVGADHGGSPALCRYRAATNAWDNFVPCYGSHGYQFTAASTTDLYRIICGGPSPDYSWMATNGVYKWDGSAFAYLAPGPENMTNLIAHTPGVWWPGKGLAIYDSNYGRISILDAANQYIHVNVATGQARYYHTVSAYSSTHDCVIFGGGAGYSPDPAYVPDNRKLWRINADLSITPMPDAPHHVGIFSGMNLVAGPDGNVYLLGFGEHWKLDPAGVWTQLPAPPAGTLYPNDHDAVFSSCTPSCIVYVMGRRINGALDIKMRVYKP